MSRYKANCNFSGSQDMALLNVDLCWIFLLCFSVASKDTKSLRWTEACSCLLISICCLFPCSCLASRSQASILNREQTPTPHSSQLFMEGTNPFYTHSPLKKTLHFNITWNMHTASLLPTEWTPRWMCVWFFLSQLWTCIKYTYKKQVSTAPESVHPDWINVLLFVWIMEN